MIELVPNAEGWWWRFEDGNWNIEDIEESVNATTGKPVFLRLDSDSETLDISVKDDGYWGGPVTPPNWTPK